MAAGPGAAGTARVSSGRDLSCVPEVAGALGAVARQGFDFLCIPLFHPRHRREFGAEPARARPGPQTRSDLVLAGRDWNTLIVGKLSPWIRPDSPLEHVRKNSQQALRQELDFGAYLGLAAHLVPLRGGHNPNLARGLSAHLHSGHHATQVPLVPPEDCRDDVIANEAPPTGGDEENTWEWWHNFRTLLDYNKRAALALEIGPDLPSPAALARWLGEPVRAAFLPTRLFLTNKKGFPVLARGHQRLLGQLLKLDVQIIVQGCPRHGGRPLSAYLQYLEHLGQHRPPPSAYELYARGYEDYLQSPLQPLMDNLESQTYEVFEKDPIKYCQYQQAIFKCLQDRVPEEERETNVQVVMVLGAGRGPLVAAALRAEFGLNFGVVMVLGAGRGPLVAAALRAEFGLNFGVVMVLGAGRGPLVAAALRAEFGLNFGVVMVLGAGRGPLVAAALRAARQAGARLRLYAVEKNPNAVVTLENCQWEEWGSQVSVVSRDMRGWAAPERADLVVSELLGSFGDNELSPECLDGARGCLKEDGVSIPQSYTSFLAPVSSSKLYNEVRGCREHDRHPEAQFETPYVVRLHNFHQVAPPLPCFSFQHPNPEPSPDNSRYTELTWQVQVGTVLHGFAGYFETRLYGDVTLSIRPETHSPGLFSWFPIFFPIKQPVPVRAGQEVSVAFWRVATPTKVWYEWAVTSPACSALHNPTGRSYTIGL